jgi:flagellar basal body-associated protein FliL
VARSRQRINPFYILLVMIGIAFTITACAYFVMALRGNGSTTLRLRPSAESVATSTSEVRTPQPLMEFMDRHGMTLLVAELALLAVATCGAISTDSWWSGAKAASTRTEAETADKPR